MTPMKGKKFRRPSSAEQRAFGWVREQERIASAVEPGKNIQPELGTFTVRRAIKNTTHKGIHEQPNIMSLLKRDHGSAVPIGSWARGLGVSLVTPREGARIASRSDVPLTDIMETFETVALGFPTKLSGFLGRAVILGAPPKKPGSRFIGFSIDRRTQDTIRAERQLLLGTDPLARKPVIPHVTLFMTGDQELATESASQLNDCAPPGIPLDLGRAEVIPIQSFTA